MHMSNVGKKSPWSSVITVLVVFISTSAIIEIAGIDQVVADLIYRWEGNQWHFKNEWITAVFIHKGGKYFSIAMLFLVIILLFLSYISPLLAEWKHRLQYLLVATMLGSLIISLGKATTNISCPWDFSRYGGTLEYLTLIEQLWVRNGSQCVPAGHASAGFTWVALYFVGHHTKSA